MPPKGINFAEQTNLFRKRQKQQAVTKSLIFAVILVLVTGGVYGFFRMDKNKQVRQLNQINSQVLQERNSRDFESLAEMLDVTTRLDFISKISQNQLRWSGFFHEIEGKLLPAVYLEDWEGVAAYSTTSNGAIISTSTASTGQQTEGVTMAFISPSLNDISKQIVALNASDKISSIIVSDIQLEDVGLKVTMQLAFTPEALSRKNYPEIPAATEEESISPDETTGTLNETDLITPATDTGTL